MTALKVGDVVEVDERHYMYGTGRLILRATRIGDPTRAADGEWLDLDGLELWADGSQLRLQPRHATVRVDVGWVRRAPDARP